jgi:hypothetical protein
MSFYDSLYQSIYFSGGIESITIFEGIETKTRSSIMVSKGYGSLSVRFTTNRKTYTVSDTQIRAFSDIFERDSFKKKNSYREIKDNQDWRNIYGVDYPNLDWIDPKSGAVTNVATPSVYCRACGIYMPLKLATVDHQRPQAGGAILAVCRVFRALGLTEGGATGAKGQYFNQIYAASVGGTVDGKIYGGEERYTLNPIGEIYYSLLQKSGLMLEFKDVCMHSVYNLRPVCGPCNSSLSNSNVGLG